METKKILAQYKCSSASAYEQAYVVSSSPYELEAVISTITVCNIGASAYTFRLCVVEDSAVIPPADKTHLYYDLTVEPGDTFAATLGITLSQNDGVYFYVSNTSLVINIFGVEIR